MCMQAALSSVDVLVAFATFSHTAAGPTCRPEIIEAGRLSRDPLA